MNNSLGEVFQVNIFGESHGEMMGVTINGLAPGLTLDLDKIKEDLALRRPKRHSETPRVEQDDFKIVSGYFNNYTTGAPLTIIIENKDIKSSDYDVVKDTFRPSHADYPAYKRYLGYNDYRGGGIFSGRLTALITIAGSIANTILKSRNIIIETHIKSVQDIHDDSFNKDIIHQIDNIRNNQLHVINKDVEQEIISLIDKTKDNKDSIGAVLESVVLNVEAGLGEPFFNKLDSVIAKNMMSIPAIKGVSFGSGFNFKNMLGSAVSDEYYVEDDTVKTYSNHNGGIIGGLTSGMPIIVNTVVKPTSTLNRDLRTVTKNNEDVILNIKGRHDSSIFTRIPVVVNSMLALTILDMYCIKYGYMFQRRK